jgi:hypothetical protein
MIRLLLTALLVLAAPTPALAQGPSTPEGAWSRAGDRITLTQARISLPERAGVTALRQSLELSRQGEGLDNALQYVSPDERVFATVYIYYPGLPHAGVTAFVTDRTIAMQGAPDFRRLGRRIVGAGGREGVAIRGDYSGFREGMASSAAFIKADRWIVKLRVSGPQNRQRDVQQAMTELLAGLRFEGQAQPREAAPLAVGECAPGADPADARQRPELGQAELAAHAFIATLDGGGLSAREANGPVRNLPSRLPAEFCVSGQVDTGGGPVPILRAADGEPLSIDGRTVLLVPISDNGTLLEVVHAQNLGGYILLYHQIGSTSLLGEYEGVPSDRQIRQLMTTPDHPAGRARAVVENLPNGDSRINLIQPSPTPTT